MRRDSEYRNWEFQKETEFGNAVGLARRTPASPVLVLTHSTPRRARSTCSATFQSVVSGNPRKSRGFSGGVVARARACERATSKKGKNVVAADGGARERSDGGMADRVGGVGVSSKKLGSTT